MLEGACVFKCTPKQAEGKCSRCADERTCTQCATGYGTRAPGVCVASCILNGATDYLPKGGLGLDVRVRNGFAFPQMCVDEEGPSRFFGIGDWGGAVAGEAVDNTWGRYVFNANGLDKQAQRLVAEQMNALAEKASALLWSG